MDSTLFEPLFTDFFRPFQRGKHLEQYRALEKYYIVSVDGSEYFISEKLHCPSCLTRKEKKRQKAGKEKPHIRYPHQIVQATLMHPGKRQVIPLSPETEDAKGRIHIYERTNEVPLNDNKKTVMVNYVEYRLQDKGTATFRSSRITDFTVDAKNVEELVRIGRCRWKIENEVFNTRKNQGYSIEHNYEHGKKHLSMNFFILNLPAFFMQQIFELTDEIPLPAGEKTPGEWCLSASCFTPLTHGLLTTNTRKPLIHMNASHDLYRKQLPTADIVHVSKDWRRFSENWWLNRVRLTFRRFWQSL